MPSIDAKSFYTPAQAASLLGVREDTVKRYCRLGHAGKIVVETKKQGPKQEWRIKGSSIIRILDAWGLSS
jgi:hypothetical protein